MGMAKIRTRPWAALLVVALAATLVALATSPAFAFRRGRMTGGGRIETSAGLRVTHGFELYCITQGDQTLDLGPNNLQVNWADGIWHLEDLTRGACHSEGDPRPPRAPFNAYYGQGFGRLNGESGSFACWRLVDNGEPGRNGDVWSFRAWPAGAEPNPDNAANDPGKCPTPDEDPVVDFRGRLLRGNHQAHRLSGNKA
jgi:hypothetical protein